MALGLGEAKAVRETAEAPSSDILYYIIIHMYIAFASAKLPTFEELLQESGEVLWGWSPGLNGLRRLQELTEHWREEPAVAELEMREGVTGLRRESYSPLQRVHSVLRACVQRTGEVDTRTHITHHSSHTHTHITHHTLTHDSAHHLSLPLGPVAQGLLVVVEG